MNWVGVGVGGRLGSERRVLRLNPWLRDTEGMPRRCKKVLLHVTLRDN